MYEWVSLLPIDIWHVIIIDFLRIGDMASLRLVSCSMHSIVDRIIDKTHVYVQFDGDYTWTIWKLPRTIRLCESWRPLENAYERGILLGSRGYNEFDRAAGFVMPLRDAILKGRRIAAQYCLGPDECDDIFYR